jgi:hypothetical protein
MKTLFISDASHAKFAREINVKSSIRKGRVVKAYKRRGKDRKPDNLLRNSAVVAAAGLGLSVGGYALLRGRYRVNLKQSARVAQELSKKVIPANLTTAELNRPNINYAVAGLNYGAEAKSSKQLSSYIHSKLKGHTIPIDTRSMNKLPDKAPGNSARQLFDLTSTAAKEGILKGYNPTARELAATVKANIDKYPDKIHTLHGHSSGGYVTNEAMHILKEMGVNTDKIKQITYGANSHGILPPAKNSLHILDNNDWQAKPFKFPGAVVINKNNQKKPGKLVDRYMSDHGSYHYLSQDETNKVVRDFVIPKDYVPPKLITVNTPKSKPRVSVNTKPNTSLKEEISNVRQMRQKLKETKDKYNKTENNSNIPANKKEQALMAAKKKLVNAERLYKESKVNLKTKISDIRRTKSQD